MREGHKGRGKKGWIAAAAVVCVAAVVVLTAVVLHGKGVFAGEGGDEENVGQTKANTISLTKMNLTNSISATGTLESAKTKTVSADLNQGKVKSVKVSVGDKVKKGQTIVLFDTDELQDVPELVCDVKNYIFDHLTEQISLDDLSRQFYFNGKYISAMFKKYTGMTIRAYILDQRITLSKRLLREGSNVSEACYHSGFLDYTNFIRSFTRAVGMSPGKYSRCAKAGALNGVA